MQGDYDQYEDKYEVDEVEKVMFCSFIDILGISFN